MAKRESDAYSDLRGIGRINARIIDADSGLTVLSGVYAVRIHSKHFYALIMNDYLPTLGQVKGSVIFLNDEGEHIYSGICGFYKHQHNEFTLLVEERLPESKAET